MVLDISASPILERYKVAKAAENTAVIALHGALASGVREEQVLLALTKTMERTHDESMGIYAELNAVRLDK